MFFLLFCNPFQNTLIEWMRLLAVASHEYMKMMVYELEQVSNRY